MLNKTAKDLFMDKYLIQQRICPESAVGAKAICQCHFFICKTDLIGISALCPLCELSFSSRKKKVEKTIKKRALKPSFFNVPPFQILVNQKAVGITLPILADPHHIHSPLGIFNVKGLAIGAAFKIIFLF